MGTEGNQFTNHIRALIDTMIHHRREIGVDRELEYARNVVTNRLSCFDDKALDFEKEINQSADSVSAGKRDDAISWYLDLIVGSLDKLYTVNHTPQPSLPRREEEIVVDKLEQLLTRLTVDRIMESTLALMEQAAIEGRILSEEEALQISTQRTNAPNFNEVTRLAKQMKSAATQQIFQRALVGAKRMERQIHDIMVETGFSDELIKFLHDFATYPYAVMRDGFQIPFKRRKWSGNTWVTEDEMIPYAKRISPFNFYWSPDSTTPHDGTAVGDVLYLRRIDLENLLKFEKSDNIKTNIKTALDNCNLYQSTRDWLENIADHRKENQEQEDISYWELGKTIPCFRLHFLIDDCMVQELGIEKEKPDLVQFEAEVWLIDKFIVRFELRDPSDYRRPYLMEKFRHLPGRVEGQGLMTVLKSIETKVRATDRNTILNIGYSSAPVTLRDTGSFVDPDSIKKVVEPGDNYDIEATRGSNVRPVEYVTVPNITNQLRAYRFDLTDQADEKSAIPRFSVGIGTLGSNVRSANMLASQMKAATRNMRRQMTLISRNVVVPYADSLFQHLMRNGDDQLSKVDASVQIGGIENLVNKEFVLGNIQNMIQYLAPFVREGKVPDSVINQLLYKMLTESGIDAGADNPQLEEELNATLTGQGLGPIGGDTIALDGRSNVEVLT